jgi:glucokinase
VTDDAVVAIDIGGTKLAAALVGGEGALVRRAQRPTPVTDVAEDVWDALTAVIAEVDSDAALAIGVGCGGPMRDELVSPLNIPAWRDFPLADRLRESTGRPVALHNDAIAMAIGEQAHGVGRDARAFLGIVVSTGVGGGLVLDGRAIEGPTGNAGHIGHLVVDADGPPCACGGRGCLEAIARGPAVVSWARGQGWTSTEPEGRSLVAAARAGDPIALAALTRAGRALGIACASTAALFDLDLIAIGGGLSAAGDLLLAPAVAAYERHAGMEFVKRCRLVLAMLGNDAGLVGAGVLARQALARGTD